MTAVAVTGIGVVSAFGHGVEPFWRGLTAGACGLRPIRRFEVPPGVALGGEVPPLERREVVLSAIGRRIDWVSLMALAACRLALADAGLGPGALEPARTGLGLGSAWGNLQETAAFLDRLFARGQGNPLLFPNLVFNAPLSYASIELGITGPTAMLSAGEASGEAALAWGAEQVAEGAVDVCLAGGADELGAVLHQVLREGRLLARAAPRPLDPAADGACPGEGAAVLVLEPLARARARGGRIHARLVAAPGFAVPAPVHGWARDPVPLAARWMLKPGATYGYNISNGGDSLWMFRMQKDGRFAYKKVADTGKGCLPGDLRQSPDDRFLYVSCLGGSEVQAWDIGDPEKPKLHDTVGGIVQANMMHVTYDGRRLYFTNSAISSLDYSPRYALRLIQIGPDGRLKLDPTFVIDFSKAPDGPARPHDMLLN